MCKKKRKSENTMKTAPTMEQFIEQFKTDDDVINYLFSYILPCGEFVCPNCGCTKCIRNFTQKQRSCFNCNHCFALFSGTIFEGSQLPFKVWMQIIYLMLVSRRSISGRNLSRQIVCSQPNIYPVRRHIQLAMANYDLEPFTGNVDMDEVYLGGSNHGRYPKDKEEDKKVKYPVFGICEESTGRVYSHVAIPNKKGQYLTSDQIKDFVEKTCKPGATIISDEWKSYRVFDKKESKYHHEAVDHNCEYANENGYTSARIEGYWSEIKKLYYSTHGYLTKKYANLYLAEADFRHNHQNWESALDDLLKQIVIVPRVIDIRQLGRFGNRTYNLKDYRMILPACFDDIPLEKITVEDILNCDEPVYGILRKTYISKNQRNRNGNKDVDEWEQLMNNINYKDYRANFQNTKQTVFDMLKDAKKHKEVNNYHPIQQKKVYTKEYNRRRSRKWNLKKRYSKLPEEIKKQIRAEYPNLWMTSDKEKIHEIHKRIQSLILDYKKNNDYQPQTTRTPEEKLLRRNKALYQKYNSLPAEVQKQISTEYPILLENCIIEETWPIRGKITRLLHEYNERMCCESQGISYEEFCREQKEQELAAQRNSYLQKRYFSLPESIQQKIKEEYPNILEVCDKKDTREITRRIIILLNEYNRLLETNGRCTTARQHQKEKERQQRLINKYTNLPEALRIQLALKYPNIMEVKTTNDTKPVYKEISRLIKSYRKLVTA